MRRSRPHPIAIALLLASLPALSALAKQEGKRPSRNDIPATATIGSVQVTAPMQLVSRKPVIDVMIDGKGPFKFFLDTGAGATVVNRDLADELKLPILGDIRIGDPASPQAISANQVGLSRLEIGTAVFSDLVAVSWDRSGLYQPGAPRGVLGMPLFATMLLTVDYPRSQVVISRGELPPNELDVVNYKVGEAGLFSVPITIAGVASEATLDTGSPSGLSFPNSFMELLPLASKPIEVGRGRTVAAEVIIYGAKLNGTVKLGNQNFENLEVRFNDRLKHINIGYGLLNQCAVTIDQKNHRIRFKETTPTSGSSKPA